MQVQLGGILGPLGYINLNNALVFVLSCSMVEVWKVSDINVRLPQVLVANTHICGEILGCKVISALMLG